MSSSGSFREHAVFLTNHDETIDEALVMTANRDRFSLLSVTRRDLECSIVDQSTVWLAPAHMETAASFEGLLSVGDTIRVGSPADNGGQMGFSDYVTVLEVVGPIERVYNGLNVQCMVGETVTLNPSDPTTLDSSGNRVLQSGYQPPGPKYMYRVNTPLNATQLASYLPKLIENSDWHAYDPTQITHINKFVLDKPNPTVNNPDFEQGSNLFDGSTSFMPTNSWSTSSTSTTEVRLYENGANITASSLDVPSLPQWFPEPGTTTYAAFSLTESNPYSPPGPNPLMPRVAPISIKMDLRFPNVPATWGRDLYDNDNVNIIRPIFQSGTLEIRVYRIAGVWYTEFAPDGYMHNSRGGTHFFFATLGSGHFDVADSTPAAYTTLHWVFTGTSARCFAYDSTSTETAVSVTEINNTGPFNFQTGERCTIHGIWDDSAGVGSCRNLEIRGYGVEFVNQAPRMITTRPDSASGTYHIGLRSLTQPAFISQNIAVKEGHEYEVRITTAVVNYQNPFLPLAGHKYSRLVLSAYSTASGSPLLSSTTIDYTEPNSFRTISDALKFTADGTSVTLRCEDSGHGEVLIDNIVVLNVTPHVNVPHNVYKMNYPATSELKLTLDRGISDVRRITLVGYHIRSSDPGYLDLNLRSQDYYTLRIKELQGGGGLLSNKPGVHNGFAVISAGNSVHRPLGAVEYEIHDPAGIATAVVSSAHPLKTLTVEVLNMNGEPAKVNKLHLWFKVLTSSC